VATASAWADRSHLLVFADAAVSRAGVAAAAILWGDGNRELRTGLRLGEPGSFSSLDAELAGIMLAAHLVATIQGDTIVDDVTIYSDSQAAIACINHRTEGASRKLLKATRKAIEVARKGSGGTTINLRWCPGHTGVPGIEEADAEASRVASGHTHPPHLIPKFLADFHPATNPSTFKQSMKAENKKLAEAHWSSSAAGAKFATKYPGLFPRHFLVHTQNLSRSKATLLYRLITGHVQLRQHLHRLQLVDTPQCDLCGLEPETVTHFLFRCSHFAAQRQLHLSSHGADFLRLSYVLHATPALDPLFDYVKATGRFADLVR
jgi:ribonuclease HI